MADEVGPVEVGFSPAFGGSPFDEEGIEIPIWLNACMMLCINLLFPPEFC